MSRSRPTWRALAAAALALCALASPSLRAQGTDAPAVSGPGLRAEAKIGRAHV